MANGLADGRGVRGITTSAAIGVARIDGGVVGIGASS
jgi:hypothetical protein